MKRGRLRIAGLVPMRGTADSYVKKFARSIVFWGIDFASLLLCRGSSFPGKIIDSPRTILIIELARVGDLLISMPLFASIRKTFPQARITLICTEGSEDAVAGSGLFNEVFVYRAFWEDAATKRRPTGRHVKATLGLLRMLKKHSFDVCFAVSCRKQPFIPLFAFLSRAATRVGIAYGCGDRFLTHSVEPLGHFHQRKMALLKSVYPAAALQERNYYGINPLSKKIVRSYLTELFGRENSYFVCIAPSSAHSAKRWKVDGWVSVIGWLNSRAIAAVLSGGEADVEYVSSIHDRVRRKDMCGNSAGRFSINEFAELLRKSQCLITVDSAPMHLAGALSVPILALMGMMYDYNNYRPLAADCTVLTREVACARCGKGCNRPLCMDFSADEVIRRLEEKLERLQNRGSGAALSVYGRLEGGPS